MRDRAKPLDPTSEPVEGTYGVRLTGRYLLAGLRSAGNTFRPVRPSPPPGSHLVAPKLHARSADWWLRRDSTGPDTSHRRVSIHFFRGAVRTGKLRVFSQGSSAVLASPASVQTSAAAYARAAVETIAPWHAEQSFSCNGFRTTTHCALPAGVQPNLCDTATTLPTTRSSQRIAVCPFDVNDVRRKAFQCPRPQRSLSDVHLF